MDDTNPKSASIDELVKELGKSPNQNHQPSNPPIPNPKPNPGAFGSNINQPRPTPPSPSYPPVPKAENKPIQPSPIKEYKSSIRTMDSDMSMLKSGQKPTGTDIPRKIENIAKSPTPPTRPTPPLPPMGSKHQMPPRLDLETKPTPSHKELFPARPSEPKKIPEQNLKTNIGGYHIPEGAKRNVSKSWLYGIIVGLAVFIGIVYWLVFIRPSGNIATVPSTTPPQQTTPQPVDLKTIFASWPQENILIDSGKLSGLGSVTIAGGNFVRLNVNQLNPNAASESLDFKGTLAALSVNPPQDLLNIMGQDYGVMLYGQKEVFDSKGQMTLSSGSSADKKIVLITEINDPATALQALSSWSTMVSNLASLFNLGQAKDGSFSQSTYNGLQVFYKNFPYPDKTVDYSLIQTKDNKYYLVITNSREAVFAVIDSIVNFNQ